MWPAGRCLPTPDVGSDRPTSFFVIPDTELMVEGSGPCIFCSSCFRFRVEFIYRATQMKCEALRCSGTVLASESNTIILRIFFSPK